MYGSETTIWKERVMTDVQRDNIKGLMGMGRIDKIPNAQSETEGE